MLSIISIYPQNQQTKEEALFNQVIATQVMDNPQIDKSNQRPFRTRNRRWSPQEDQKLIYLVSTHGPNWNLIAKYFNDKLGKSCRERWVNQLDPSINRQPFSVEEEWLLFLGVSIYAMFSNRPDKHLKNYWSTSTMKKKAEQFKQIAQQVFLSKGLKTIRGQNNNTI